MLIGGGLIVIPQSITVKGGLLLFGANSVSATTTDRFLYPSYNDQLAPTDTIQYPFPFDCVIDRLYIYQNIPAGNGEALDYTLRKNGVNTALTTSLASTDITNNDLVNTVNFAQGDLIDFIVTKALGIGSSPSNIVASMRVQPL